jgi:hypothetical protein
MAGGNPSRLIHRRMRRHRDGTSRNEVFAGLGELIADSVEVVVQSHLLTRWCSSRVRQDYPGHGGWRHSALNIPAIVVTGGR